MTAFAPRLTKYIAQQPTPVQRAALLMDCRELFFGGAAGGGKSSWLLMAALQYADIPGYKALILRSSLKDADNPGSVLYRSREWLGGYPEVSWWGKQSAWTFPSGAILQFGYLQNTNDKYQYDSAEFQFCGFDELTHFKQSDYEYLFSRLRGPECDVQLDGSPGHGSNWRKGLAEGCGVCQALYNANLHHLMEVPWRMRAASNPGGPGHFWVMDRFLIRPIAGQKTPSGRQLYMGTHPTRRYIPSFLEDNPYIGQKSYRESLSYIDDPVTRYRKEAGDWGVTEQGCFRREWIRRYLLEGSYITLGDKSYLRNRCEQFLVVDPAASSKSSPGARKLGTTKSASWTVVSRWLKTPDNDLCLMDVLRFQKEVGDIIPILKAQVAGDPVVFLGMEYTSMSIHLYQILNRMGLPMRAFKPRSTDKVTRSVDAQCKMEAGKLWLPQQGPEWVTTYEDELFSWTGEKDQTDDQVDCTSYAAMYVTERAGTRRGTAMPEVV